MRLGLLADIHEAVEPLRAAVAELKARRVDWFVVLGDVLDQGERVDETVALLSSWEEPGSPVPAKLNQGGGFGRSDSWAILTTRPSGHLISICSLGECQYHAA